MTKFDQMISVHKRRILDQTEKVCNYLIEVAKVHDNDKVESGYVYDTYQEYFPKLKEIDYGTEEYVAYEKEYFKQAHYFHAQNRHHYYNPNNKLDDIDLFDLLEAIFDIRQSQIQYSDYEIEKIMTTFKTKGVLDLNLEELAFNTLKKLEELDENKSKKN